MMMSDGRVDRDLGQVDFRHQDEREPHDDHDEDQAR